MLDLPVSSEMQQHQITNDLEEHAKQGTLIWGDHEKELEFGGKWDNSTSEMILETKK